MAALENSGLPARYELRKLGPEHAEWAAAIVAHSNAFYSGLFSKVQPDNQAKSCLDVAKACHYLMSHQIASGHSLGVFDTEYQFKRPESAATGGKLYWHEDGEEPGADAEALLDQLDAPLVSVAMAYDAFDPLDEKLMAPLFVSLPSFGTVHHGLVEADARDPETWKPRAAGEVLFRAATSTRRDYEGKGLMKRAAHWMMRDTAARGFRGIQIETVSDAVYHVWTQPPAPFRAEVASEINTSTYEVVGEDGEKTRPLAAADQTLAKVFVHLK